MNRFRLIRFVKKPNMNKDFISEIAKEVDSYKERLKKKGSSASIFIDGDQKFTISDHEIYNLINYLQKEGTDIFSVDYILNGILLYDDIIISDLSEERIVELVG